MISKKSMLLLLVVAVFTTQSFAEVDVYGRKKRRPSEFYAGVAAFVFKAADSFDGKSIRYDHNLEEYFYMPKLDSITGQSIAVGLRAHDIVFSGSNTEIEVYYGWASPDAVRGSDIQTVEYMEFGSNFRTVFRDEKLIHPYVNLGIFQSNMKIERVAFDWYNYNDAVFTGWGLNLGGGVTFSPVQQFAFGAGLTCKPTFYLVKGGDDRQSNGLSIKSADVRPDLFVKFYF
jgi:hypothetical protein